MGAPGCKHSMLVSVQGPGAGLAHAQWLRGRQKWQRAFALMWSWSLWRKYCILIPAREKGFWLSFFLFFFNYFFSGAEIHETQVQLPPMMRSSFDFGLVLQGFSLIELWRKAYLREQARTSHAQGVTQPTWVAPWGVRSCTRLSCCPKKMFICSK